MTDSFQTLVSDTRSFLAELADNNSRDWFLANKARYDSRLKGPALSLLDLVSADLGKSLGVPINTKLFRPHRDVRFSKDKTPYHVHLHMLWSADLGATQPLNFFLGIAQNYISVGAGMMGFDKTTLVSWRALIDGPLGVEAVKTLEDMEASGLRIAAPELKRVPAPYDKDHPRGEFLKRKSLVVWRDFAANAFSDPPADLITTFDQINPATKLLAQLR